MPGVLKMLHLAEDDGVSEVDVRRGRIEADLDGQALLLEPPGELILLDQVDGSAAKEFELHETGSHGGRE
jgi:hypothetical protein